MLYFLKLIILIIGFSLYYLTTPLRNKKNKNGTDYLILYIIYCYLGISIVEVGIEPLWFGVCYSTVVIMVLNIIYRFFRYQGEKTMIDEKSYLVPRPKQDDKHKSNNL